MPGGIFIGIIIALNLSGLAGNAATLFLGNLANAIEAATGMEDKKESALKIVRRWIVVFLIVA